MQSVDYRIAKFWKDNAKDSYYSLGVKFVSDEDLVDNTKFYYGRYKIDLIYQGLNVDYVSFSLKSTDQKQD